MKIDEKKLVDYYFDDAITTTKQLIRINSYEQPPKPGMPFGQGINDVLQEIIRIVKELGFQPMVDETKKYAYFDYGDAKDIFVILCHLDVVPPGDLAQWYSSPFDPIIKDGKLIGRGSFDDKGPTVMNLYALEYLKDHGFVPSKYKIRFIFGLNEETNWACMEKYVEDHGYAAAGYVPDGLFPCVYAEKWICTVEVGSKFPSNFKIKAGEVHNVVCETAEYEGDHIEKIKVKLDQTGEVNTKIKNNKLIVQGKPGHASVPSTGINAVTYLCHALSEIGIYHPLSEFIAKNAHLDFSMKRIFGNISDETGDLTQNIGILNINDNDAMAVINFRVPVFTNPKKVLLPILKTKLDTMGLSLKVYPITDAIYIPKDSEIVKTMLNIYQNVTNDLNTKPQSMGGGTYAKAMPNLIAFGAAMDIENATMHSYNESVELDQLKTMLKIYAHAIYELTK